VANGVSNSLRALFGVMALDRGLEHLARRFTQEYPRIEYLASAILLRSPSALAATLRPVKSAPSDSLLIRHFRRYSILTRFLAPGPPVSYTSTVPSCPFDEQSYVTRSVKKKKAREGRGGWENILNLNHNCSLSGTQKSALHYLSGRAKITADNSNRGLSRERKGNETERERERERERGSNNVTE